MSVFVFNGKVVSGTRGRKQRTRSFDAFESMNFPELAIIRDNRIIRYYTEALPAPEDLITYDRLNDRVFVLKLTPEVNQRFSLSSTIIMTQSYWRHSVSVASLLTMTH